MGKQKGEEGELQRRMEPHEGCQEQEREQKKAGVDASWMRSKIASQRFKTCGAMRRIRCACVHRSYASAGSENSQAEAVPINWTPSTSWISSCVGGVYLSAETSHA